MYLNTNGLDDTDLITFSCTNIFREDIIVQIAIIISGLAVC
jgi:hypothetical protein